MMRRWLPLVALLLTCLDSSHSYIPCRIHTSRLSFVKSFPNDQNRYRRATLMGASTVDFDVPSPALLDTENVDDRPHEQRAIRPRTARRLNHSFRYLYRHDDERYNHTDIMHLTPLEFLVTHGGYTREQVLQMNETFPPLLDLNVRRHLWPKLRFLKETIGVKQDPAANIPNIPPQYFGARLERTIAPRHAFLMYHGLPHGQALLQDNRLQEFLLSCRRTKQFSALCNRWRANQHNTNNAVQVPRITAKQIEAFDVLFQRGLMAAARNELVQDSNTWPLQHVNISSAEIVSLLLLHGANPTELDARGVSLLHWAAGCGNLLAVKVLLPYFKEGVFTRAERDGATPFHWAAAGAKAREFGCGGHVDVCRYFLQQVNNQKDAIAKRLINTVTKDGNSILAWAAWSGSLEVVKLLVRNRADTSVANRNGCTVAHWAASGGDLPVCQYLAETVGVDFTEPNHGGNTPLTHAVAFGRADVVEWLRNGICSDEDDVVAAELAVKFVGWTDGDRNRKNVLDLFVEDWSGQNDIADDCEGDGVDEPYEEEIGSC